RQRRNRRDFVRKGESMVVNYVAPLVRAFKHLRLFEDWIAEAFKITGRFHHLDERTLNPACQYFLIDFLTAEWATSRFDRLGVDQLFRLTYQRRARQEPGAIRHHQLIPRLEHALVEVRSLKRPYFGQQILAGRRGRSAGTRTNGRSDP